MTMPLTWKQLGGFEEKFGCSSSGCAAHPLQLCINEGIQVNAISRAIASRRKLVGHFCHSTLASNELRKLWELCVTKLQQDCPTRWNSTYYMISSLLESRLPIVAVLSDENVTKRQHRSLDLSSDNSVILEHLVKCLKPSTIIMSEEVVSLSSVLPVIHSLNNQLVLW